MKSLDTVFEQENHVSGDHLMVGNLTEQDISVIGQLYEQNLNAFMASVFVQKLLTQMRNHEFLCLTVKDIEGTFLGVIELYDFHEHDFELGYRMCPAHEGKGICTKAVGMVLEYMKQFDITHITAHVDEKNTASYHILLTNGFKETGRDNSAITMEVEYENHSHQSTEHGI